jgi:hypothetical protein
MLSSVLFAALISQQASNPTIDFESRALAIGPLLERLSVETKTTLKAAFPIAHQVVFVRAKQVPLSELKSRLAEALDATWIPKPDGEYLEQTPDQKQQIWTRHVTRRQQMVDSALATTRKGLDEPFDGKALARGLAALKNRDEFLDNRAEAQLQYQAEKKLFDAGPISRLMRRLVLACNPKDLAAVGAFDRRIFAFKPTRMQFKIGEAGYRAALSDFSKEQQAWIDTAATVTFKDNRDSRTVTDPRSQLDVSPTLGQKVYLEVIRGQMAALLSVNLIADRPIFGTSVLSQMSLADPARKFLDAQMNPVAPAETDPIVALSPDSMEFQKRMSDAFRGREVSAPSPRMLELILGVDKNEPLGWTVSDGLLAFSSFKKTNLIAVLPDQAMAIAFFGTPDQPLRAIQFTKALVDSGTLELNERAGWTVMTPSDAWESAEDFAYRGPIAKLMQAMHSKGALEVRDLARYAFESKQNSRTGLGGWWPALYDRSFMGTSDHTDWNALRLFGSFPEAAQRDLENGKKFPLAGLNPEQRKIIEKIVYAGQIRSEERLDSGTSMSHHPTVEPTEEFANGLPAGLVVTARSKGSPVIVAYGQDAEGRIRPLRGLNAWTLATIELDVTGNAKRMADYGVPNLVGYGIGNDKMVSLRVELSPGIWKESTIIVAEYPKNAKPVSWEKLPESFRKQIADAIERRKEQKKTQGGDPPPP